MEDTNRKPESRAGGADASLDVVSFVREERSDATIVHVIGELSFATSRAFESAIVSSVRLDAHSVVNLIDCTYLEAAALGVLVRARRALGGRFRVVAPPSGIVRRVLDICNFPL